MTYDLTTARRIVVKIGSALLINRADGGPARDWLAALADDVAAAKARGQAVCVVSSGAVALGRRALGFSKPSRLAEKQAAAAAGQARLMSAYEEAFRAHHIPVAQALLTLDDTERRRRWLNARATFDTLLAAGAVPIVNENDTVATTEIRYGDNDRLSARVAQMISADALLLLSDVDGLYERDPRQDPAARHIPVVAAITPEIEAMAGGANAAAGLGTGGMRTKIEAAKIAARAGCAAAIVSGGAPRPLSRLLAGERATWFLPSATPEIAYKAWIAGRLDPKGALVVDAGAAAAIRAGKSLLPAGLIEARGDFEKGDAVVIIDAAGGKIGRGLVRYDVDDARRIKGLNSAAIAATLGFDGGAALVHADDLVTDDA